MCFVNFFYLFHSDTKKNIQGFDVQTLSIITIIFLSVSLLLTHHSLKITFNIESERIAVFYKWLSTNVEALCP